MKDKWETSLKLCLFKEPRPKNITKIIKEFYKNNKRKDISIFQLNATVLINTIYVKTSKTFHHY